MRVTPLAINRPVGDETGVDRTPAKRTRKADAAAPAAPAAPLRGGLQQRNPQFNQQLAAAQQTQTFLEQAESRLQALKSELSARLADGQPGDRRLERQIGDFSRLWQQRRSASAGRLDGQLGYSNDGPAQQRFRIRGIDRQALTLGEKETLAFSVGATGQRLMVVGIDAGLPEEALLQRFALALAPAGIRVAADVAGPVFSVAESAWSQLRDSLAARGGGLRLPAGQLTRLRTDAEPDAIRPASWQTGGEDKLRRTLQEVIDALGRVRRARELVDRVLAEARRQAGGVAREEQAWALSFAAEFEALATQPAYQIYTAIAPAVASVQRDRVIALLSLASASGLDE